MKRIEKIRTVLLCVTLLIILAVLGVASRGKKEPIVIDSDKAGDTDRNVSIALKNVSYSATDESNFKEWDLKATSAHYFEKEKKVVLEDLKVNFYRTDGRIYHLTGNTGELGTDTRNIRLQDGVCGELPDGTAIQAGYVFYDHSKRIITTKDKVVITRGASAMEGVGMVIDLREEKLSILGKVKAQGIQ